MTQRWTSMALTLVLASLTVADAQPQPRPGIFVSVNCANDPRFAGALAP